MTVSKQFLSWKVFGMSPWHILVVKDMMCNRPWVIAIDSWRVPLEEALCNSGKLFFILVFKTTVNIYSLQEIHPAQSHVDEAVDNLQGI